MTRPAVNDDAPLDASPPISLGKFLTITGTSPVTAWRWEKRGWLKTVRIAGRKYISAEALREFQDPSGSRQETRHEDRARTPRRRLHARRGYSHDVVVANDRVVPAVCL
ncbi:MAG: hypothetical protein WCN98_11075, partial [Verrucomicrobiaceae bacterium]